MTKDTSTKATSTADGVKDTARELRDDATETAQNLKERAADEAARQADAARSSVAREISDTGDALRHAADELRDGSAQERTFGYMATALADLSDSVRNKDLGEVVDDVSDFARQHPGAFLGGAALLGFAGMRMAKASRRDRHKAVDVSAAFGSDDDDDALEQEMFGQTARAS